MDIRYSGPRVITRSGYHKSNKGFDMKWLDKVLLTRVRIAWLILAFIAGVGFGASMAPEPDRNSIEEILDQLLRKLSQ